MDLAMGTDDKECREAMRYTWAGIEFAITVVMFAAAGFWLDRYLETLPGFTVVLGITGLICAIYRAIRDAMAFRQWLAENKQNRNQSENDSGSNAGDASE
jgi:F0F1-type ATP synthase assembly protein I